MSEPSINWVVINGIPRVGFLSIDSFYRCPYPNATSLGQTEDTSTPKDLEPSHIEYQVPRDQEKLTAGELRERIRDYIKRRGIVLDQGPLPTY